MPTALSVASAAHKSTKGYPIVLVTGGSGYIGSHTVLEIIRSGCAVVVVDSLINSHMESLIRVYYIAKAESRRLGLDPETLPPLFFHAVDLCDKKLTANVIQFWHTSVHSSELLKKLDVVDIGKLAANSTYHMRDFSRDELMQPPSLNFESGASKRGKIVAVVHFAALKAVGESVSQPLRYYQNNITGLLNLLDAMERFRIHRLVFSSSAVVYGSGKESDISEDAVQLGGQGNGGGLITNPYGRTKWMAEEILHDCCAANSEFQVIALRYFNPTGAHPSGLIGEDPKGKPNNIVPAILQAYQRRASKVYVFGSDYETSDGTGVRDYIHVEDLGRGHVAALKALLDPTSEMRPRKSSLKADPQPSDTQYNYRVYNLGSGTGYSVLEVIKAFAAISGTDIPYAVSEARPGDLGKVTASTTKAMTELGWQAQFGIQDMCRDVYAFAAENPLGYQRLRKLSTLALRDPKAFRKASVDIGNNTNLEDVFSKLSGVAIDRDSFQDIVRQLSTMSDEIKNELRKDSIEDVEPPITTTIGCPPQASLFSEKWHHSIPT